MLILDRDSYSKLSEDDQCALFSMIGQLACASARTLLSSSSHFTEQRMENRCSVCDLQSRSVGKKALCEEIEAEVLFSTIGTLLTLPQAQKRRRPRFSAMASLKRLLSHCGNASYLDLAASSLGQGCLQGLRSSSRDLRVAAGYAI